MSQHHYVQNFPAPLRIDDYAVVPDPELVRFNGAESAEMMGRVLGGSPEFCSDSHRLAYERKQNELAIDRLYAHQPASPINPKLDLALDLVEFTARRNTKNYSGLTAALLGITP